MKPGKKKQKILMLGGSHFQIPAILYAREVGNYVVTCDYLPDNPGHQYAHEYYNVSTTDKEAVLELAQKLEIDGIVAYASDPAAPTAAFVAEKMSLPGNPFDSVKILTEKDLYRDFLHQNGFNSPPVLSCRSYDEIKKEVLRLNYPVVVKPVDSSGSKGVTKVDKALDLKYAVVEALKYSRCKRFVVEGFIRKKYPQLDGDIFVYDGKIIACYLGDQGNDDIVNPFVPASINYPSLLPRHFHEKIEMELQRAIDLLKMNFGGFNIEVIIDQEDRIHLLEIGPRNGGNCIPDIIKYASNVDMIKLTIDSSLGIPLAEIQPKPIQQFYTTYVVHSDRDGVFDGVLVDDAIAPHVLEIRMFVKPGDGVRKFMGSNCTLGIGLLGFPTKEVRDEKMSRITQLISVVTRDMEMKA
ncbi:MAG: hypothetical protein ACEPOZ_09590 [Marinifilaceae bacterium]